MDEAHFDETKEAILGLIQRYDEMDNTEPPDT